MKAALVIALAIIAAPAAAQFTNEKTPREAIPVPSVPEVVAAPATSDPASALTDKEQATMKRCKAMPQQQQAQSSKCSAVMKKAGGADPATARAPAASPM